MTRRKRTPRPAPEVKVEYVTDDAAYIGAVKLLLDYTIERLTADKPAEKEPER